MPHFLFSPTFFVCGPVGATCERRMTPTGHKPRPRLIDEPNRNVMRSNRRFRRIYKKKKRESGVGVARD